MKYFLIFISMFVAVLCYAGREEVKAVYWTHQNDTFETTLKIPVDIMDDIRLLNMLQSPNYTDQKGKRGKMDPEKIAGFIFRYDERNYVIYSLNNVSSVGKTKRFYLLRVSGYLALYAYEGAKIQPANSMEPGYRTAVRKGDGPLTTVKYTRMTKEFAPFVEDCEDVHKKVKSKYYRYEDLDMAVQAYNKWYYSKKE